jgi:hypothetical protein
MSKQAGKKETSSSLWDMLKDKSDTNYGQVMGQALKV